MSNQTSLRLNNFLNTYDHSYMNDLLGCIDDRLGSKSLFSYQLDAVRNAMITLKHYQDSGEIRYFQDIYGDCNTLAMGDSNKASFCMSTGSGKTVVMVKLIKELLQAIKNGFIDDKPILTLAPNDSILRHIEREMVENDLEAKVLDVDNLKTRNLADNDVFLCRSDKLGDSKRVYKGVKRIDYHNYLQDDGWYILLYKAHGNDIEDSKTKSYIRELSRGLYNRKGFIFSFSDTFTDDMEMLTCAYSYHNSTSSVADISKQF